MKLIFTMFAAVLLAGCTNQKQEARIAKLEANLRDVTDLVGQSLSHTQTALEETRKGLLNNTTNTEHLIELVTQLKEVDARMYSDLNARIDLLEAKQTNRSARVVYQQPARVATRGGVPVAVYSEIAAEAAQRYPRDYDMQEYVINNQINAYKKLHGY